jgi:hypothetical protein
MKKYKCHVYYKTGYHFGCTMNVNNADIQIRILFIDILTISLVKIRKIYSFKNSLNIFKNNFIKIEHDVGINKTEIIDIRIRNRHLFLEHMSKFEKMFAIEEREKFMREK